MKICKSYKRKEIENNNIRRKALNDINEVDHINFQTKNKIEKLKHFFAEENTPGGCLCLFHNQNKSLREKTATCRDAFRTLQNNCNGTFL